MNSKKIIKSLVSSGKTKENKEPEVNPVIEQLEKEIEAINKEASDFYKQTDKNIVPPSPGFGSITEKLYDYTILRKKGPNEEPHKANIAARDKMISDPDKFKYAKSILELVDAKEIDIKQKKKAILETINNLSETNKITVDQQTNLKLKLTSAGFSKNAREDIKGLRDDFKSAKEQLAKIKQPEQEQQSTYSMKK